MSRELRLCPGVGGRKCGAFLSSLDRDPHPTCTRCRGKVCTRDLTCDFCARWSSSQWEAFAKRTCAEMKRSHPPGSLPPVSQDAPGAASLGASSPPARLRFSERGGSDSGHLSGARELASVSSALSGVEEGGAARPQRTPLARTASSVASPRSSLHALRGGESGESSEVCSRSRSSRVSQSSDRGTKKDRGARSRSGSSRGRSRRSRSRSASRSRSSSREHRQRDSSPSLSSRVRSQRDRSRSSDRYWLRRVRSRSFSRRDRSQSSDRYRPRQDRSRSSDHYWSRQKHSRSPARRGIRGDHSQSRDPPASGHGCSRHSPLTVRGQGIEAGEPDVSNGRVWRRCLSPRLLLSLERQPQWLLLLWGVL